MKIYYLYHPKHNTLIASFLITLFICFMLFNSSISFTSITNTVNIFLYNMLPAIFPFIFITNILIKSGASHNLTYGLSKFVSKLYNIPVICCPAIIMGFLLGYPNAATHLNHLYTENKINSKTILKMLSYTSNASPAFIIATIGIGFYNNIYIGIIFLVSHFLSALILGLLLRNTDTNIIQQNTIKSYTKYEKTSKDMFLVITESMICTLKTLGIIFCFTTIFAIISTFFCNILNLNGNLSTIVTAILELTHGMQQLASSSFSLDTKLILTSFFLSFGSFMIIYQIYAVVHSSKISLFKFIFYKILHGIISSIITYTLLCIVNLQLKVIPTFSNIQNVKYTKLPEIIYILAITIIFTYIFFRNKRIMSKKDCPY